ncbi:Lymphotoxin-beta [Tupaia chinensis]|uniref:Lymphotoxin-beta n=1 Tax=Tupaia chinensis TaxID=246437 RepID=L9KG07_TUPCH|nr:Lymphotoxin-beta [Tupaia chinensis]
MGALGLEGRGGRPQGRGCLLLAVAGATSPVTLLLAVPITVLAVLALVPREQAGLVTETSDPGAQAQKGPGIQELPEEEPEASVSPPAAHLIAASAPPGAGKTPHRSAPHVQGPGARVPDAHSPESTVAAPGLGSRRCNPSSPRTSSPEAPSPDGRFQESFLRRCVEEGPGTRLGGTERRGVPEERGAALGRRGAGFPAGRPLLPLLSRRLPGPGGARSLTLRSSLYRAGGAYGPGVPELLLEGAETVSSVLERPGSHGYGLLWYTSVGFGGLVQLRRGEMVYVNISHPDMVDYARGKTFFGAVMVG